MLNETLNVNSLTPMSDQDNFSLQYLYNYQPDKWWQWREIPIWGKVSWSNTKFSELTL